MTPINIKVAHGDREEIFLFSQPEITIGKKIESDIYLDDAKVSRCHAKLIWKEKGWHLKDLDSLNGTCLNGKKVKEGLFFPSDLIQISHFQLRMENKTKRELPLKEKLTLSLKESLEGSLITRIPETKLKERLSYKLDQMLDQNGIVFESMTQKKSYIYEQLKELLGLGFLENYLSRESVSEIMINGPHEIYVEEFGNIRKIEEKLSSEAELLKIIDRILTPLGRRVDEASPLVDARLPDGSRIHIALPPISLNGPLVTIRKFSQSFLTLNDLIAIHSIPHEASGILQKLIMERKNLIVSGGTSSGKTTLLNVLANCIPDEERIIVIEDLSELKLPKPHTLRLESRPPNIENKGELSIRILVQNALRMRPDRIIVGECRGGEAFDMLQAMNTGHEGCLSTCHSNSPRDTLKRIETMVMMAGFQLSSHSIKEQIASAIHTIIQMKRDPGGKRRLTHITKICGIDQGTILTQDIFNSTKGVTDDIACFNNAKNQESNQDAA